MKSLQLQNSSKCFLKRTIGFSPFDQVDLYEIEGKLYAVKKIYLVKGSMEEQSEIELLNEKEREYSLMKKGLMNVLKIYDCYHDQVQGFYEQTMSYCNQNLKEFIQEQGSLNLQSFLPLFDSIVTGELLSSLLGS